MAGSLERQGKVWYCRYWLPGDSGEKPKQKKEAARFEDGTVMDEPQARARLSQIVQDIENRGGYLERRGKAWHMHYWVPTDAGGVRHCEEKLEDDSGRPLTRKEADIRLTQTLADISRGQHVEPTGTTVAMQLQSWLERQESRLSPSTIEAYRLNITRHLVPALGNHMLEKIRPKHIQEFYDSLQDKLSPKTIKNIHGILHCALDQALRMDTILSNPADRVTVPTVPKPRIKIADEDQLVRILAAIATSKYRVCVLMAMSAGLRRGEILAIKWEDLNEANGELTIRRAAVQVKGEVIMKSTKSGNERIVVLPATMLDELRRHKAQQAEAAAKRGEQLAPSSWMFTDHDGSVFTIGGFKSEYYRLKKQLGFDVTLHGLRHTWVTEQLAAGTPSEVVQKMSGHATMGFMHDRYGHAQPRHQEAAAAVSERLLHPKPSIRIA